MPSYEMTLDTAAYGAGLLRGEHVRLRALEPGDLSISIGPNATNRGFGSDAVKTAVRYGFEQMGLNRIELRVLAMNPRALAACTKVGFVREGVLRESVFFAGGFHNQVVMGILRRDWPGTA